MAWLLLIVAGFCELGFIGFLQKAISSGKKWYNLFSFASMAISLILLAIVTKTIALSVAYAVWTGIGAILVQNFPKKKPQLMLKLSWQKQS